MTIFQKLSLMTDIAARNKIAAKFNIPTSLFSNQNTENNEVEKIEITPIDTPFISDIIEQKEADVNPMAVLYHTAYSFSNQDYFGYLNIQDLTVKEQNIDSLTNFKNLTELKSLYLDVTVGEDKSPVTSIDFIKNLKSLTNLTIHNVKLESLHALLVAKSLKNVKLYGEVNEDAKAKVLQKRPELQFEHID